MPRHTRLIVAITLALAVLYAGWWTAGYVVLTRSLPAWAEDRRAEGWQVDWTEASVTGFPSRFDTTLTEPALADPATGWAWTAPFFQVFALSYRPTHLIAVWPPEQTLWTPLARYALSHEDMRASLRVTPGAALTLESAAFDAHGLTVQGPGWSAGTARLRLAARQTPAAVDTLDLGIEASTVTPAASLKDALDPVGVLPASVETLRLTATVAFDAPWDRAALERRRPQPTRIDLTDLRATWGGLDLRVTGDLDVDTFGLASGRLTVKATNWRQILTLAEAAGLLRPGLRGAAERGLAALAAQSGPDETLDVPLTVSDNVVSLGILPLGRLPPLILR